MRATDWEFRNRALVFGLIFAAAFSLYSWDHPNSTAVLSNFLGTQWRTDPDLVARAVLGLALAAIATTIFCYRLILREEQGLKAQCWYWGFPISVRAFITLNVSVFYAILGASLALFWGVSIMLERKSRRI